MDLPFLLVIALAVALSVVATRYFVSISDVDDEEPKTESESSQSDLATSEALDLFELAERLESTMDKTSHPSDVLSDKDFQAALDELRSDRYSNEQVANFALGANWVLSCVGLEALTHRGPSPDVVDRALSTLSNFYAWPLYFLINLIERNARDEDVLRLLCGAQSWWQNNTAVVGRTSSLVEAAMQRGIGFDFGSEYQNLSNRDKGNVDAFVRSLSDPVGQKLSEALEISRKSAVDRTFLRSIGTLIDEESMREPVFETEQTLSLKAQLNDEKTAEPGKSILVVGESGVGKSSFASLLADELLKDGWVLVRTSANALIADKKYIGEIEGQVKKIRQKATVQRKVAIFVENMPEFGLVGRHKNSDQSVLDQLWPQIVAREVLLVGEATPTGLQVLLQSQPSFSTVWRVVQLRAATERETRELAIELLARDRDTVDESRQDEVVRESLQLAQQYLTHRSLPGSVLSLLRVAVKQAQGKSETIDRDKILAALSQVSGLPQEVLDERQVLNVEGIRERFRSSVIGQDEAVDCLVERIAMLKAGLIDPSRPIGVFLFAGPTGTGKTEIAKTLARMLFGAEEQMIRLDMSEFQDVGSTVRLVGSNHRDAAGGSLVEKIREKPFSIVLLDEFEKAHAKVWDLFLQVFDDGRMTDANGRRADFRHAIIILTSNLGATISNEAGIGFTSKSGGFSSDDVMRVVNRTFRREFVNRLDRVVVFNPLSRDVMRVILEKELRKALTRRGLRSKQWAIELEDSAIEFLLSEGFTHDLGARPLRRAIEKHFLAPLSMTMVQNLAPTGEQFLFVRSNGQELTVEFIDPDADHDGIETASEPTQLSLARLILAKEVPAGAVPFLEAEILSIADRMQSEDWSTKKSAYIDELNADGFWERPGRFEILDRIELMDRIDSAMDALLRLLDRLQSNKLNRTLVSSLAGRVYVAKEGMTDLDRNRPTQAFVGIRRVTGDLGKPDTDDFLSDLASMYENWFKARGMRFAELNSSQSRYDVLYKVSGFGCFGILESESGLHVYEAPVGDNNYDRIRVRVEVAGVPVETQVSSVDSGNKATAILDESAGKVEVVRRYRREPSPLVRDGVRHWRTGKIDVVYGGHFDIIGGLD
ncbi:MAG: AAA family ATPase [Pseudomonadota bacterium]